MTVPPTYSLAEMESILQQVKERLINVGILQAFSPPQALGEATKPPITVVLLFFLVHPELDISLFLLAASPKVLLSHQMEDLWVSQKDDHNLRFWCQR